MTIVQHTYIQVILPACPKGTDHVVATYGKFWRADKSTAARANGHSIVNLKVVVHVEACPVGRVEVNTLLKDCMCCIKASPLVFLC